MDKNMYVQGVHIPTLHHSLVGWEDTQTFFLNSAFLERSFKKRHFSVFLLNDKTCLHRNSVCLHHPPQPPHVMHVQPEKRGIGALAKKYAFFLLSGGENLGCFFSLLLLLLLSEEKEEKIWLNLRCFWFCCCKKEAAL